MFQKPTDADQLQELLWSFAVHRVVTVAGRTGILGDLALQGRTPEDTAGRLGLDPLATRKIIRALAALGILEKDGSRYAVSAALSRFFCAGESDLIPFIEHSHALYDRWGENLETWVRGQTWTPQNRTLEDTARFGAAMRAMGANVARQAAAALDLAGADRLLDIGGGFGHYAEAFVRANPGLLATVLDTPEVAALGARRVAGTPLEGRIGFVGGDYLETGVRPEYDVALLANVLHQEAPSDAARLVSRGAAALVPGGRLAVVDFSIDEAQDSHVMGALFAINMRSFGDTYPEPLVRDWMRQAGLRDIQRTDLSRFRWLIVGRKPTSR